jgi:hypothetical protein
MKTPLAFLHYLEESGLLKAMVGLPQETWNRLFIDHEEPVVERLWAEASSDYRVYLHRIHPCERPLYHPHPWPSAIHVLSGRYEMQLGAGLVTPAPDEPDVVCTLELGPDSYYEMAHPNGWHSVRPLDGPVLSIMVTSKPWLKKTKHFDPPKALKPLSTIQACQLLDDIGRFTQRM